MVCTLGHFEPILRNQKQSDLAYLFLNISPQEIITLYNAIFLAVFLIPVLIEQFRNHFAHF